MLIPQSLAYAMLAGLPPQAGLYASILPLVAYAALGSSTTLAVGPVAVISLMTAAALAPLAPAGSPEYAAAAVLLAFLSGLFLLAFAALRLGFIAQFLSHPRHRRLHFRLGDPDRAGPAQARGRQRAHDRDRPWHDRFPRRRARLAVPGLAGKLAPMAAIIVATALTTLFGFDVKVVGSVPQGLPRLVLPEMKWLAELWMPALLISLVGFVESVSVARSLGARRGERIAPNRELAGLGAANVASALSAAFRSPAASRARW